MRDNNVNKQHFQLKVKTHQIFVWMLLMTYVNAMVIIIVPNIM